MLQLFVRAEFVRRSLPDHLAALDDEVAVADPGQRIDVFVDDQNRLTLVLQVLQAFPNLDAHKGREPLRGFVENKQLGVGH